MRHTNLDIKRIAVSSGIFAGVLVIMCLAAVLIKNVNGNAGTIAGNNASADGTKPGGSGANDPDSKDPGKNGPGSDGSDDTGNIQVADGSGTNAADNGSDNAGDPGTGNSQDNGNDSNNPDGEGSQTGNVTDGNDPEGSGQNNTDNTGNTDNAHTYIICIDPAHQNKADTTTEPIGPGSSTKKYKVTSGATGVSGALEYELTLSIGLKLRDELTSRGYGVIMIRESNDVNISDGGRAQLANETSDMVIHIHCNAEERESIAGVMVFEPSEDNTFVDASTGGKCRKLGRAVVDKLADSTGAKKWGVIVNDNLTALNWTSIPAVHVEVGYLTNAEEEKLLKSDEYQIKIVKGIADGIDAYYSEN